MMGFSGQGIKRSREGNSLKISILLLTACCLLLATISGCGYTLQGKESLPFDSVRIGRIENRTYEPKLEDKLQKALADELMKYGIVISKNSGYVINGVIDGFELKILTEKDNVAVEYEVDIKGNFSLIDPEGKVKALRNRGAFIVSFYNDGSLQEVMASKELAIERALKDLSSEIRAGIVYKTDDRPQQDKKPPYKKAGSSLETD